MPISEEKINQLKRDRHTQRRHHNRSAFPHLWKSARPGSISRNHSGGNPSAGSHSESGFNARSRLAG
ncbi:hypothetical protein [Altericista sp. CCNU0014]|uniref:hypothetical protein n=1 Tax=Altericista sp. CCNU0014 TaxID=3082949 RepID=UPI003850430E